MDLMQALAVVDSVADAALKPQERTLELRDAMAFLRDWGVERSDLVRFWKCLEGDHDVSRCQAANSSRNRIRYLVEERRRAMKERQAPSHGYW